MLDLTALTQEISDIESVVPSAVATMKTLFDAVEANKDDPAALQALVDRGRTQINALAAAIANPGQKPAPDPVALAKKVNK